MRIRRCCALLIEPRETVEFDFESLLSGGDGLQTSRQWFALAPHLAREVVLTAAAVTTLGDAPVNDWIDFDAFAVHHQTAVLDSLIAKGLLLSDAFEGADLRQRDELVRDGHWHTLSAVAHTFSRWNGVTSGEQIRNIGLDSVADLVEKLGPPPPHFHAKVAGALRLPLTPSTPTPLDELLQRRAICRNYDTARSLPYPIFCHLLWRVFGATATHCVAADSAIVKKTSPSAGGLHPTEAYVLAQRIDGVGPGLYHYHVGDHALEPLRAMRLEDARLLAAQFVAQQNWFADAHAIVVLTCRFRRSLWKYRAHAKVYRALVLDVGHLSQTLQISATEFGLGAFVTSAINEVDIEQALDLNPLEEGPLAICGFGWRSNKRINTEFDPNHAVWPADDRRPD